MIPTSKYAWFRFSVRMLLVVTTLGAAVLSVRIEYLKRCAAFHEREADEILRLDTKSLDEAFGNVQKSSAHRDIAYRYNMAIWTPWTTVVEATPPEAVP